MKPSGRAFSAAMKSRLLVAVTFCGFTTSTIGVLPITAIGVKSPGMLNGRLFMTLGKITTLLDTTDKVKPSGGFFVSACRPITPLAPAWFSTTTAWPSDLASAGATERVMASTPEPVALGRMNLMVRSACAWTRDASVAVAAATQVRAWRRFRRWIMVSLSGGWNKGNNLAKTRHPGHRHYPRGLRFRRLRVPPASAPPRRPAGRAPRAGHPCAHPGRAGANARPGAGRPW